jgi:hypothetical protein
MFGRSPKSGAAASKKTFIEATSGALRFAASRHLEYPNKIA